MLDVQYCFCINMEQSLFYGIGWFATSGIQQEPKVVDCGRSGLA